MFDDGLTGDADVSFLEESPFQTRRVGTLPGRQRTMAAEALLGHSWKHQEEQQILRNLRGSTQPPP